MYCLLGAVTCEESRDELTLTAMALTRDLAEIHDYGAAVGLLEAANRDAVSRLDASDLDADSFASALRCLASVRERVGSGLRPAALARCPVRLRGIALAGRCTRSPVALERSGRVNRLLGNGSRQARRPNGWQSAAGAAARAARTRTLRACATDPATTSTPSRAKAPPAGAADRRATTKAPPSGAADPIHPAHNRFRTRKAARD